MSVRKFYYRGLMAPVFTPFDKNKSFNSNVVYDYKRYLVGNEIRAILVNGTTGEGTSMTVEERRQVLQFWLQDSKTYNLTVMVQVGGTSLEGVKILARNAESQSVSAILCLPDLFFKPSSVDDLIQYLKIVSNAAPCTPLLYYHIPSYTGVNLNMKELLERSKEVPTLVGIKFTDSDLNMGSSCVTESLQQHAVFLGCDNLFLTALMQGFNSAISTTINLFPKHHTEILRHFENNEIDKALVKQQELNHNIREITKHGSWVSSMKAAMRKLVSDFDVGPVRDPLVDVNLSCVNLNLQGIHQ